MRASNIAGVLLLLPLIGGCIAIKSSVHVVQAEQAVDRAEDRGAPHYAVYEYTLAARYIEKAREELGNNEFLTASELARSSAGFADQAIISMSERGVGGVDFDESLLPEDDFDLSSPYVQQREVPTRGRPTGAQGTETTEKKPPPPSETLEDEDEVEAPPDNPWEHL